MRAILIGNRQMVEYLAQQYESRGYRISIITLKQEEGEYLSSIMEKSLIVRGDATDPVILEEAQAGASQLLVAATSKDYVNFAICQTAIHLFKIPQVMAVINDPSNYPVYKHLGIKYVFNKTELMYQELEKEDETEYLHQITSYAGEALQIYEVILTRDMPAVGIEIIALGLPRKVSIIAVRRDGELDFPGKDYILAPGDRIVLAATPQTLGAAIRLICGEQG